ncbi:MAG: hypothetical protein INR66_26450, partial [Gordonia polyisoprenivorans]|nr:hypothetical protein [Gordonia polyisoprenivorans]
TQGYGPAAILGAAYDPGTPIGIIGDSIAAGYTDNDDGYIVRALGSAFSYQRVAHNSENTSRWYSQSQTRRQSALTGPCTHFIWEHGINYLSVNLQPFSAIVWRRLARRGVAIYACTITPQTTSTDSWATPGNQTVGSNESLRAGYNDWLRAGAPLNPSTFVPVAVGTAGALVAGQAGHPLVGYFEIADLAETARNSGKWKANYTGDGTHLNATGAAACAAGIDTTKFKAAA